ncbi:MAG: undecaprenyldiphospho-muramoylpentapeptide beta-N-acetylglucosaminyltransferase [Spirochaetaceae bacterium]|nr:undecaprenyldiphospho-muramoylpentapeptide beta-N-acetylglucosaminyltransferase [Spirochaetaceae bacterium]
MKIAFTGGGTGGHIYPGLAIIGALRAVPEFKEADFFWIGSRKGLDKDIVPGSGIRFFGIHTGKLRRYISLQNISDIFTIIAGFIESARILKKEKPDFLFSKGGFVSVPPCAAAALLRIPFWTHESDFSAGLATKINSFFAEKICVSYDDTVRFLPSRLRAKAVLTGNPVRDVFYEASAARGFEFLGIPPGERVLLVLGGSQGAREVNDIVRSSLPRLTANFTVVHQTGASTKDDGWNMPEGAFAKEKYISMRYIKDEMPDVLACAALVAGRSGAGMVWECAAAGKPMVLLPLSGSGTRGDQVENARYFSKKGAALYLLHPSAAEFADAVENILQSGRLPEMAAASAAVCETRPAQTIAALMSRRFAN